MAPPDRSHVKLSRRERQIMDVVYRKGEASTSDVLAELPDAPSNSATRALLRILEKKGYLRHRNQDGKYVFTPTHPRGVVARSALRRVLDTFFDNSVEKVFAAILGDKASAPSDEELARVQKMIAKARQEGR
jgi:predicted transcriptional regulator